MRWLAGMLLLAVAVPGSAQEAVDFHGTVRGPDGKPAVADVWLVTANSTKRPYRIVAEIKSDANGQFQFGKELIDSLWKQSINPQIVARDAHGRISSIISVFPGPRITDTVKLQEVGEIRGRVLNVDGQPIAGAKVEPFRFAKVHVDRQWAEPTYLPPELTVNYSTQTDADGRFVVRGVPKGGRLVADIRAERSALVVIDWDTTTPLELRVPPPATIGAQLTGGAANDRAGREVTLETVDLPGQVGKRDALILFRDESQKANAEGIVRFTDVPPGRYRVYDTESKIGPTFLDPITVEIKPDSVPSVVQLPLKAARKLRGKVIDASGVGVAGVTLNLGRNVNQGGPFGSYMGTDSECVSGPDGQYEGFVKPGDQAGAQIREMPEGIGKRDAGQVLALNGETDTLPSLVVEKIEPLIVNVVDEHGKPVSGAEITASGAGWFFPHKPKPSGPDGVVKLLFADRSEDATLKASAGEAVSEPLKIDPAQERGPLTMTVSPANAFRFKGQVVDRSGRPIAGAEVGVMHMVSYGSKRQPGAAGSGFEDQRLTTDADGRFAAGPHVAGDQYSLTVRMDGYRSAGSARVIATKGTTHDFGRIVLQRIDAVVRGQVVDAAGSAIGGATVINSGDAPTRLVTKSAADGSFELRGLAAGVVHVAAFKDDFLPAWVTADTDKSEPATLMLRKRGELSNNDPPPTGIDEAAVRAAAKQVLEKLWEWPEARKSPVDKKVIELMARLDPEQARRWSGKTTPDEPTIDQLVESDLDEALAQLATKDKNAACREMKRLVRKLRDKDKAKALRLAEELAVQSRSVDPRYRLFDMADAGRLLAELGRADAGRKLVEEAAAQAEKLPASDEWNRYVRGHAASRLALFDLPRAKRLLDGATNPMERSRYAAMCANVLAASDPKATAEMLDLCEKGFYRDLHTRSAAYVMAATNPDAAAKLLDYGDGSSYTATGYGWIALAVAPRDKALAHRMIDRGFRAIHERALLATGYSGFGGWGEAAASLALIATEVDYLDRAPLIAHVIAERPTDADVSGEAQVLDAQVGLALLLSSVDHATARRFLDVAEANKASIGGGHGRIGKREHLAAWAMIDPQSSVPLLIAEVNKLKEAGDKLNERNPVLDVIDLMTTTANTRRRAISRFLAVGWPDPEEIE